MSGRFIQSKHLVELNAMGAHTTAELAELSASAGPRCIAGSTGNLQLR
jgi:hypothetical protein